MYFWLHEKITVSCVGPFEPVCDCFLLWWGITHSAYKSLEIWYNLAWYSKRVSDPFKGKMIAGAVVIVLDIENGDTKINQYMLNSCKVGKLDHTKTFLDF